MTVTVRAGELTRVEPQMGLGARLGVKLQGAPDPEDRGALAKDNPGAVVSDLDEWASLVQFQLLAPQKWPIPVLFSYELGPGVVAGSREVRELRFGSEQESELLPSGSYTLEARTRGGRVVTTPVELVDGCTTSVTVRFPSAR